MKCYKCKKKAEYIVQGYSLCEQHRLESIKIKKALGKVWVDMILGKKG